MPVETPNFNLPAQLQGQSLNAIIRDISEAKQNIAQNFFTIGQTLAEVQAKKLYQQGGFQSFYQFLRDQRVDIAPVDAERFIAMTQDENFKSRLSMGLSKMLELMKLEPQCRQQLLQQGGSINGSVKPVEQMNLTELKKAAQEMKRQGKIRCDRCARWVDHTKEIDGKFYGSGGGHSCYEREMEERRALNNGRIPAAQMDSVLNQLQFGPVREQAQESVPLQWVPESLYQLYGQLLQDQERQEGEITVTGLKQEKETLKKLIHLCQTRQREIQDTLALMKELDSDADSDE